MKGKFWMRTGVGVTGVVMTTAVLVGLATAQQVQYSQQMHQQHMRHSMQGPANHVGMRSKTQKEQVTLDIRGADTPEGARLLGNTLSAHQIDAPLQATQGKPCRITASIDPQTDLGAIGLAVMSTNTPDNVAAPPSLDLVLFGKFDAATAKKATQALAKMKGVDATGTNADLKTGELNIRVRGGAKVTADQIHRALQSAGVGTQFTRSNTTQRG